MLYRIHKNTVFGKRVVSRDTIESLHLKPEQEAKLIDCGALSPVQAPPLAIAHGWRRRSELAATLGIEDMAQFIEADNEVLCKLYRVKEHIINKWKTELFAWIVIKKVPPRGG